MRPCGRELASDELTGELRSVWSGTPIIVRDGDDTEHSIVAVDVVGDRVELIVEASPYAAKDDDTEEMRAILREVAESKTQTAAAKRARAYIAALDAAVEAADAKRRAEEDARRLGPVVGVA